MGNGHGALAGLVQLCFIVLMILSMWRIFEMAGRPGWASLIPFYNGYVLFEIAGKPGWWLLLLLVPLVNIVIVVIASIGLARSFGKQDMFAAGLVLLPFIFYPILAFGESEYVGPETH